MNILLFTVISMFIGIFSYLLFDALLLLIVLLIPLSLYNIYLSQNSNSVLLLFNTMFLIFYILPIFIFGFAFIQYSTFTNIFELNIEHQFLYIFSLNLYLAIQIIYLNTFRNKKRNNNQIFKNINVNSLKDEYRLIVISIYLLLFSYFIYFNLTEAYFVLKASYQEFQHGQLEFKKSFIEFIFELIFLFIGVYLYLNNKNNIFLYVLVVYAISLMLSGQRFPGFSLFLTLMLIAKPEIFNTRKYLTFIVIGLIVGIPFLQFVQTFRVLGFAAFSKIDFVFWYKDVWSVIGFSSDTIKASLVFSDENSINVSPFAKLFHVLKVFSERVLGINVPFTANGFATEYSIFLAPELYHSRGVTFASSGLAEAYHFFGIFGFVVYPIFVLIITKILSNLLKKKSQWSLFTLLVFCPKFFTSVRNELLGWFWEGLIHSSVLIFPVIIFYIIKFVINHNENTFN